MPHGGVASRVVESDDRIQGIGGRLDPGPDGLEVLTHGEILPARPRLLQDGGDRPEITLPFAPERVEELALAVALDQRLVGPHPLVDQNALAGQSLFLLPHPFGLGIEDVVEHADPHIDDIAAQLTGMADPRQDAGAEFALVAGHAGQRVKARCVDHEQAADHEAESQDQPATD